MSEPFDSNVYTINLSHVKTAAEIVYDLTTMLDSNDARNKKICLKLGNIDLNQSQILSIKSLISSINSILAFIDTNSHVTANSAQGLGIVVEGISVNNTEIPDEPEMTYKTIEEVLNPSETNVVPDEYKEITAFQDENVEVEIASTPRGYEKLDDHVEEDHVKEEYNNYETDQYNEYEEQTEIETPQEQTEHNEEVHYENQDSVEETHYEEGVNEEEPVTPNVLIEGELQLEIPDPEVMQEELNVIFDPEIDAEKKLENILDHKEPEIEEPSRPLYTDYIEETKEYTEEDFELDSFQTKYIKQTIRSGQIINFDGNIVIIGDCHPGSEISALGDITVWGVLSGIAHAGSNGNTKARIRALNMNAIQLRIADCYARRPDALNTVFVEKTNTFVPEEARIINDEIVIFKTND